MGNLGFIFLICPVCILVFLAFSQPCIASVQQIGIITPGYEASQMSHIDHNGLFLLSNDSTFAFGFKPTNDATLFLLVIIHRDSSTVVWTANTASPVANSDKFVFWTNGSVSLQSKGKVVWEPDTGGKLVSVVELQNSGNLVLLGSDNTTILWESFRYPTNTLLSNQDFVQGMQLSSIPDPTKSNLTYVLEIKFGDLILSTGHNIPQTYWSLGNDTRKIINKIGGVITSARIESNLWKFYDNNKALLWQLGQLVLFSNPTPRNSTLVAVLRSDGFLAFYTLGNGPSKVNSPLKIPDDPCGTPEPCDKYLACSSSRCRCPSGLVSRSCNAGISAPCGNPDEMYDLVNAGDYLSYFALGFTKPSMKTNLDGCQASCASNCSCLGLIFDKTSHNFFLFDWIGSFITDPSSKYSVYVKVSKNGVVGEEDGRSKSKHLAIVISTVVLTVFIVAMVCGGYRYHMKKKKVLKSSEDESFFEPFSGMPVRYSYKFLQEATNNFSLKLGQGGFGSVYQGKLPMELYLLLRNSREWVRGLRSFEQKLAS